MENNMGQPLVSVIMGVFNQWDEGILQEAVYSVLRQTCTDLEFIIWDDGSHPDAARSIRKLAELDERIILAGRGENKGLAYSLNACIRLAKGKYIARMDADDISKPQRLEKQVAFLETHPEYGWCGTDAELFDEQGVWGCRLMPEIPTIRDYFRYSPYIHPSVVFRASLFDENMGYLASEETLHCEDYEIFLHLARKGQQGYNLRETLFCYRETKASYRKRKARFRFNEAKIRWRNFKKMGVLFPIGWLYVLRPLAACLIPAGVLEMIKRMEGSFAKQAEENRQYDKPEEKAFERAGGIPKKARVLQGCFTEKPLAYAGGSQMHETAL